MPAPPSCSRTRSSSSSRWSRPCPLRSGVPAGGPSSAAWARTRSSRPVTGATATRRPNRFETASMAAAAACCALAAALDLASAPDTAVVLASGLALLTLAWIVGVATEQLGESSGPKVGGVLNATFGHAAELIITIFAIRAGQLEVATASITGSILGNTLLVLGASFVVGGVRHGTQTFDRRVAGMSSSMLTPAVLIVLYVLSLVYLFRSGAGAHPPTGGLHWPARSAIALLLVATTAVA